MRIISLSLVFVILMMPVNIVIFADEVEDNSEGISSIKESDEKGEQTIEVETNIKWKCHYCNQENDMKDEVCIFCFNKRDDSSEIISETKEVKLKNLKWHCPQCGEYINLEHDICIWCGEQRPTSSLEDSQLYYFVYKKPTLHSVGKWLTITGVVGYAVFGGFEFIGLIAGGYTGLHFIFSGFYIAIINSFLFFPGLIMFLLSLPSKEAVPVKQNVIGDLGYNFFHNYSIFANQHIYSSSVSNIVSFGFTF